MRCRARLAQVRLSQSLISKVLVSHCVWRSFRDTSASRKRNPTSHGKFQRVGQRVVILSQSWFTSFMLLAKRNGPVDIEAASARNTGALAMAATSLLRTPAKRAFAGLVVLVVALISQVQLAGVAYADEFRTPCADVGRFSDSPAPAGPGDRVLFCDTATHTWFILPENPARLIAHDVGTTCGVPYDTGRSPDNKYLLTCINGLWVPGN